MQKTNKKAFSLGEILLTMFILGFLFVIILPILNKNANERQRMAVTKKGYRTITKAYANEFAVVKAPMTNSQEDLKKLFEALHKQISAKMYYKFETNEETGKIEPVEISEPNPEEYENTWIESDDGIAYSVGMGGSDCATKLDINAQETSQDAINSTCLYVTMDINGYSEPNKLCSDDEDIGSLLCDRINFFVSTNSIACGNHKKTIGGRLLYDATDKDD